MATKFTKQQIEQMIQMRKDGVKDSDIAELFLVSVRNIRYIFHKEGVQSPNATIPSTPEQQQQIVQMRKDGASIEDISRAVGVTESATRYILGQHGVTLTTEQRSQRTKERIQKNDPNALSEQDKQRILELRQQNKPLQEIADLLNTDKSRVKWFLYKSKVTIPEDVAQQNAYRSKLKKNPNAMEEMRSKVDVEYRNEQIRKSKTPKE